MLQRKLAIITGTIIMIFGMLFYFQGLAIVGPKSSFMYSNPQWVTYGVLIFSFGVIFLVGVIFLIFLKKR
jgi:TRAP-type C4-dicarboxylate transport system permease small subunit